MPALDTAPDDARALPPAYTVECHACTVPYDTLTAAWCNCIVKERTLVCPACEQCFCRADADYKRRFWIDAPESLWERKQRQSREQWTLPPNPEPEEAARPLVLVVDDDREVRAVATNLIGSWGCGWIHAANGAEALQLARSHKPDVILTDALMPKMDGRELCRLIKADPELASMKVIIMSSVYTSGRFKREALSQFKADEFVSKPIDARLLQQLVGRERTWVRGESGAVPAIEPLVNLVSSEPELPVAAPLLAVPEIETEIETKIEDEPRRSSLTVAQVIHLRALGVDGEIAAMARRIPGMAVRDLIALRAAGIPADFITAIELQPGESVSVSDWIAMHSVGCDPEHMNILRRLGFSIGDAIGIIGAEVPLTFVIDVIDASMRTLSAAEIARLHAAAVDLPYLRVLQAHGFGQGTVDEWIRLWAAGVPLELIESATLFAERCTVAELLRLWLTGVDVTLLREIGAAS